jgi:hypothetical protein
MTDSKADLRVTVVDDEIIVTRPGSSYSVTYYKPENSPQLLAKRIADHDDLRFEMTAAEFLAEGMDTGQRQGAGVGLDCLALRWSAEQDSCRLWHLCRRRPV